MNVLKILVVVTLTYSITVQAREVANIKCGPSLSPGEMVVCDYAIIANKYQKLYETHLSNGRNLTLEASVQKAISECDGLSCVEQVIDKTMAQPVVEKEGTGSTQDALNQVTEAIGAKLTKESSTTFEQPRANFEKKEGVTSAENPTQNDEDRGAFGAWLMLAFIIVFVLIGYKIVSLLRPKSSLNKAAAVDTSWLAHIWAVLSAASSIPPALGRDDNETNGIVSPSQPKVAWSASQSGDVVYIAPYNGSRSDGYEWDGNYLKPYNGSRSDGLEWDGTYLKPCNGSRSDGFEWDGTYLKPYNGSRSDGFEWDGTYLKPYNGSRSDGFELSGITMRPYGASSSGGTESSPQVPIPVWAVVLGLILKK